MSRGKNKFISYTVSMVPTSLPEPQNSKKPSQRPIAFVYFRKSHPFTFASIYFRIHVLSEPLCKKTAYPDQLTPEPSSTIGERGVSSRSRPSRLRFHLELLRRRRTPARVLSCSLLLLGVGVMGRRNSREFLLCQITGGPITTHPVPLGEDLGVGVVCHFIGRRVNCEPLPKVTMQWRQDGFADAHESIQRRQGVPRVHEPIRRRGGRVGERASRP